MFLAHFGGPKLQEQMEMDAADIFFWVTQAVNVHNRLNTPPETDNK